MAAEYPWGYSSVGRAPALQAGGQGFESLYLHWPGIILFLKGSFSKALKMKSEKGRENGMTQGHTEDSGSFRSGRQGLCFWR